MGWLPDDRRYQQIFNSDVVESSIPERLWWKIVVTWRLDASIAYIFIFNPNTMYLTLISKTMYFCWCRTLRLIVVWTHKDGMCLSTSYTSPHIHLYIKKKIIHSFTFLCYMFIFWWRELSPLKIYPWFCVKNLSHFTDFKFLLYKRNSPINIVPLELNFIWRLSLLS